MKTVYDVIDYSPGVNPYTEATFDNEADAKEWAREIYIEIGGLHAVVRFEEEEA